MTKKQKLAIEALALHPTMTDLEIAELTHITPASICNWRKNQEFKEALELEYQKVWKDYAKECQEMMFELAKNGDYRAISFILSSNGYDAPKQVDINSNVLKVTIEDDD